MMMIKNEKITRNENFDLTEISSTVMVKKKNVFVENNSNSNPGEYLQFVQKETQRNWEQIESC